MPFISETRLAWRRLRRAPAFTAVAVLTLALGIAIATSFFTVVDAVLFKPIAGVRTAGVFLVGVADVVARQQPASVQPATVRALNASLPASIAAAGAAVNSTRELVSTDRLADRLWIQAVDSGYSRVLDARPSAGRWFVADDDRESAEPVAVISGALWRRWFAGATNDVGRATLRIRATPFRIVGVAPAGFAGLTPILTRVDVWVPLAHVEKASPAAASTIPRLGLGLIVRPVRGATAARIQADLGPRLVAPFADRQPETVRVAASALDGRRLPQLVRPAMAWLAIGVLALLAACANVGNMFVARGVQQAGETAVRISLGASRWQVARAAIGEVAIVGVLAGFAGLLLSTAVVAVLTSVEVPLLLGRALPVHLDLTPDWRVFAAACGAAASSVLLVGSLTALQAARVLPMPMLAASGVSTHATRHHGWTRGALVSVQVTVAVLLLMTTGLVREQLRAEQMRSGTYGYAVRYDAAAVVSGNVDLGLLGYTAASGRDVFARLLASVRGADGVDRAALGDAVPGGRSPSPGAAVFDRLDDGPAAGRPRRASARLVRVSPGYFAALGLPMRSGRDFGAFDAEGAPRVAVVSESFARAMWPDGQALGRSMTVAGAATPVSVVGIVVDPVEGDGDIEIPVGSYVFVPFAQDPRPRALVVVRTDVPATAEGAIRSTVAALDSRIVVEELRSVEDTALAWLTPVRVVAHVMTAIGLAALGIAMLGVYGVVACFVSMRTRELGIRAALGAGAPRLLKLVIDYAIHVVLVGLLPGVLVATLLSRVAESQINRLMPNEIATWVVVPLLVLVAGVVAGLVPAVRAARVDPATVLRDG